MDIISYLYQDLIDALSKKFGIENEYELMRYLSYRYCIVKNKDKVDRYIVEFMFYELDIIGNIYQNISFYYDRDHDLNEVYENIRDYCGVDISYLKNIRKNAKNKSKKMEKSDLYETYMLYYSLKELNRDFNAINIYVYAPRFEQRKQNYCHILEEQLENIMNCKNNTTTFISENDLENYIVNNLNLIEDGLKFKTRQYILPEGRIDILAEDKYDNLVIIELKIEEDKKIVWQSLYYPIEMKKKYPNRNIRMITIMPKCPNYLLEPLIEIGVETYEYNIVVIQKQIKDLTFRKVGSTIE